MNLLSIEGAMLSDRGCLRPSNEDCVGYTDRADPSGRVESFLAVVADGMGGHAAGEVASEMAVEIVLRGYFAAGDATPPQRLASCLAEANAAILAEAQATSERAGMGTTATVVAFEAGRAWTAQVGDSRAYLVRDGAIRQITDDQTLVARMVRDGVIASSEAATHPDRNVILQALGTAETLEPEIDATGLDLVDGDVFVLCSDGLSNELEPDAILAACDASSSFAACERLVGAALARGARDNVSVGVFRVRQSSNEAAPSVRTRAVAEAIGAAPERPRRDDGDERW